MLNDPTPRRVSSCPVHFIWDGQGKGRMFVRAGFITFLGAMVLATGERAMVTDLGSVPRTLLMVSAVAWVTGQLLTLWTRRTA